MAYENLKRNLDTICTLFSEGEAWHRKSASECRRIYIRGWGRWHEAEAGFDEQSHLELSKLIRDNPMLQYSPNIDVRYIEKANQYMISDGMEGFRVHHEQWQARENRFAALFTETIPMAFEVSDELYSALRKCKCEVENEAMRVGMAAGRLELAGWNGHDVGVCSKWIHHYFECEYDGGKIDFNIG